MAVIVAGCNPFESSFIKTCEAALKDTLLAPSTYRRVVATESRSPIPLALYLAQENKSEAVKKFLRQQNTTATRFVVVFEYDAANAYGTPLRLSAECSYDTTGDDPSSAHEFTVRINGKTKNDRMADAIRRLNQ